MSALADSSSAERCTLAPGLVISRIVTGLWQIADMERHGRSLDPDTTAAAMRPYVDAGLTTFDMADHYGSAEVIAGRFRSLDDRGTDVQLLTKWVPPPGRVTRADVRSAVQRALARLQSERIDLLQFHAWSFADPAWLDALFCLQELKQEGLIHHIGVTNFDTAHLRVATMTGIELVSNQVSCSLLDRRAAGDMKVFCLQHHIALLAYGTVAGGLLTDRWLGAAEPVAEAVDTWSRMKYLRFVRAAGGWSAFQSLLRVLEQVARRYDVSMANVATRFILEQPGVCAVIIGARLGEDPHLEDNLRVFAFQLDPESRAMLEQAARALQPIPGDCGDEYRRPPYLTAAGDLRHHVSSFPAPYQVVTGANDRTHATTGTVWEEVGGFSRAVRHGDRVFVSGTTATHRDRVIGGNDPAAQMSFVIDKIEGALQSLGARLEHVVRTRVYLRDLAHWEPVTRVHGHRFRSHPPANTLVQAGLVGEQYLVEMEAEAIVS